MALTFGSEPEVLAFMLRRLGNFASILGYSDATESGPMGDALIDAYILLGVESFGEVSDHAKLRAAATYTAWVQAANDVGAMVTFAADGASYNRSDLAKHAESNVNRSKDVLYDLGLFVSEITLFEIDYNDLDGLE